MSSVDEVRKAAEALQERASAATHGEWVHNPINGVHTQVGSCIATTHRHVEDARRADAAYIATMHPGVGAALAQWLSNVAHNWEAQSSGLQADALDVASLINGGAAR